MDVSSDTLLKLLRIALGNETNISLPNAVDWRTVMNLSLEQGVAAIAMDGLQSLVESHNLQETVSPDVIDVLDSTSFAQIKYDWYSELVQAEQKYQTQWEAASRLARLYAENGIKTVVLKGFSIGQYYPIPNHRTSCDLDCYLISSAQSEAELIDNLSIQEEGNRIVEGFGIPVCRDYYRNSSFRWDSLHVENHRYCTYIKGSKRKKRYEVLLRHLLFNGESKPIKGTYLLCPPPMFLALHTVSHAFGHFCTEGISLRNICDWAVIMKQLRNEIDWGQWRLYCKEYGFLAFAETLSRVANIVCGVGIPFECERNPELDTRLLDDVFRFANNISYSPDSEKRWQLVGKIFDRRWKYKLYSDTPMIVDLLQRGWGFLFEKNPRLPGLVNYN